jgi:hypothetical protein
MTKMTQAAINEPLQMTSPWRCDSGGRAVAVQGLAARFLIFVFLWDIYQQTARSHNHQHFTNRSGALSSTPSRR